MKESDTNKGLQGRPRNHDITQLLLSTALSLAYEGGVRNTTIDKIVQVSGIAKTTIYRRWPNVSAIVIEAFLSEVVVEIEYPPNAHITDVLRIMLKNFSLVLNGKRGDLFRNLLAEVQNNKELSKAFWENWNNPQRIQAKAAMERAVQRGEISPGTGFDIVIDSVIGAVYYRILIPYKEIDDEFSDMLINQIFEGIRS